MPVFDISIIILAKNEEKHIKSTLDMILKQDIDKKFEVILIDSGSRDSTVQIARNYPIKILEISAQEFSHGNTRNQGGQLSEGEFVVFLNADAIPMDKNWLRYLIDNFKGDQAIVGVYSSTYPYPDCNPLRSWEILNEDMISANSNRIKYIEDFSKYQKMNSRQKRKLLAFQTISCAIKKEYLLQYPFKDIEFGEDLEWSKRMMEKGFKVVFEPQSKVLHSHDFYRSFIKTLKKYFDDAKLNNQLLNIWSWQDFPLLIGHFLFKILRDAKSILSSNRNLAYKISWLFYSPVIRLAEFIGIILGSNSRHLSPRLQDMLSLAGEIRRS